MNQKLTTTDHSRSIAGLKYVYPVISRRAGGLSIGINLNTNNACNWRCVYCQVPDLVIGAAPVIDMFLLEQELRFFLELVISGDFFDQYQVAKSQRVLRDIAISGNGEPTSLKALDEVIELIGQISTEMGVFPNSHFVLISNGSLMHQQWVQKGLKVLNKYQGQVWFKLDSATEQGRVKINNSLQTNKKILENLKITTELCETLIQTCLFEYLGTEEIDKEYSAYVELFKQIQHKQIRIKKIMLYTLARPSLQPESKLLRKLNEEEIMLLAKKLELLDYKVTVSC